MSSKRTVTTIPGLTVSDILAAEVTPPPPKGEGWESPADVLLKLPSLGSHAAVRCRLASMARAGKLECRKFQVPGGRQVANYYRPVKRSAVRKTGADFLQGHSGLSDQNRFASAAVVSK